MNWLTNFVRPKISALVSSKKDVPDNLWQKCGACEGMLFHRDLRDNLNVCYHCGNHMRITVQDRLEHLFDDGYQAVALPKVAHDPLKFKDRKRYADRLKDSQAKTKAEDAIVVGHGTIGGVDTVIAAFNFAFMGGSMGTAVGEGIVVAARKAVELKAALIVIPASGGARMQEGALSLMQMPRSIVAVDMVKAEGLPYIVLLTNPTTGGVSASFAMLGDIHIAEPGAMIGFAGKRVIEETIREKLPEGFQMAEYLHEHGMVDMVVARKDLPLQISKILRMLVGKAAPQTPNGPSTDPSKKSTSGESKASNKSSKKKSKSTIKAKIRKPRRKTKAELDVVDIDELPSVKKAEDVAIPAPSNETSSSSKTKAVASK